MTILKPKSTRRGGERTAAHYRVGLLRVDGRTLTVNELAAEIGATVEQIRARARKLIHQRRAYTLDNFRGCP